MSEQTTYKSYISRITIERRDPHSLDRTYVAIEDEGGGPFMVITQNNPDLSPGEIRLDFEELDELHRVAGQLGLNKDYTV